MNATHPPTLNPETSEVNARVDYWLREFGEFPTLDALIALRPYAATRSRGRA